MTDEKKEIPEIDISKKLMTVKDIIGWLQNMPDECMDLAFSTEIPAIPDDGATKVLAFMRNRDGSVSSIITKVKGSEHDYHEAQERANVKVN